MIQLEQTIRSWADACTLDISKLPPGAYELEWYEKTGPGYVRASFIKQ